MLTKKYYDGFTVHDILNKHLDDGHKILELLTAFADAHGVDAVPVIKCKDCKHYQADDDETYCDTLGIFGTSPTSYCSFAKRRDDER